MNKNIVIELSTSQQDWELVRECYVQSFRRYPLYKYMVPDDNKRDAFLRAYLNANYEVTVANGNGILLVLKILEEELDNMAVEGGILFVFPSDDGHGWAITDDEPYWEAYEKYGLAKISPDGLERVKRYEAWENENICKKLTVNRIPMWNGLFCAISPKHASKGLGSTLWKDGMKILKEYFIKRAVSRQLNKATNTSAKHKGFCTKLSKELVSNHMHYSTLLNHRKTPDLSAIQDLNGSLQKESLKNDQK
uniref:N-acetyltransferase domain-containing protein n=1 Tax=Ciona savignyi TaxID=51511 RepID=H2ZKJ6_CIOSA